MASEQTTPTVPTSESAVPTTTDFPTPGHSHAVAIAVTVVLVGLIVAVGGYFLWRIRHMKSEQEDLDTREKNRNVPNGMRRWALLDHRHPASRITPFGSRPPGSKMRIATRRTDGAWEFQDPEESYTPNGVDDPSPLPSPISPSASVRSYSHSHLKGKAAEARMERETRRDTGNSCVSSIEPPPPAYHPDVDEGYSNMK